MRKLLKAFLEEQFVDTEVAIAYVSAQNVSYLGMIKKDSGVFEIENYDRLFEIGSITKVFTSTVLAQLILEGKTKGNTLLSDILNYERLSGTKITLESLANHTSGLPRLPDNFYSIEGYDENNPYLNYSEQDLIDYFTNYLKQSSKVKECFEYSNLGTGILGYAISKLTGVSFQEIVKRRVFEPLKMWDSSFDPNDKEHSVRGLNKEGLPANLWPGGILSGCIGIISSARDMCKFMQYTLDEKNEVSNLQLKETFQISEKQSIGLGWGIGTLTDGSKLYKHGGGSDGYTSFLKLNRTKKCGIIILTNVSAFSDNQSPLNVLADELYQCLIEDEI